MEFLEYVFCQSKNLRVNRYYCSLQKFCIVQEMLDAQKLDVMGYYRVDH